MAIDKTIEKLFHGDSINDADLMEAYKHFENLVEALSGMGPTWRMPLLSAVQTYSTLNGHVVARGLV